ncbi:hypothetical protein BVRB_4g091450 [Beta vulgaris subsp. vulgaris]|nr:hypothetical protein BVRB_4g091450 [Beta vulgaris subsp. vulgaris]
MTERTIKARTARESSGNGTRTGAAMVAAAPDSSSPKRSITNKGRNAGKNRGRGKGPPGGPNQQPSQHPLPRQTGPSSLWPPWSPSWGGWTLPPTPFPSYSWQPRPHLSAQRPSGPGVLGSRPQAYNVMTPPAMMSHQSSAISDLIFVDDVSLDELDGELAGEFDGVDVLLDDGVEGERLEGVGMTLGLTGSGS